MGRRKHFYHGTSQEFSPGDVVRPGREVHGHDYATTGGSSYAWATTNPQEAHTFGALTSSRTGQPTRVYRVEPVGEYVTQRSAGQSPRHTQAAAATKEGWRVVRQSYVEPQDAEQTRLEAHGRVWAGAQFRARRLDRERIYAQDARLNPAEQEAVHQTKMEMDPAYRRKNTEINNLLSALGMYR
jgi:hypothetical protein